MTVGRDEGCQCHTCGVRYRGDLLVPNDVWSKIKPAPSEHGGLLCPTCIMNRVVDAGIWTAAFASDVDRDEAGMPEQEFIEAARKAIRRGVPIGEVKPCSCFDKSLSKIGNCVGVCEDSARSVAAAIAEAVKQERELAARDGFFAGYWAYSGPANEAELSACQKAHDDAWAEWWPQYAVAARGTP